jgi:plasmid stability protein
MAQLIVRNIEDLIAERLKRRASLAGISMEEAHRQILRKALSASSTSFKDLLCAIPEVGRDEDFERIPQPERETFL